MQTRDTHVEHFATNADLRGEGSTMSDQTQLDSPSSETIPAYRSVARSISERILNGELPVGSPLPSEAALAQALRINRSTVREAIRALEEGGMLRRRPGGKRLFVSAPRHSEVANRMKAAMVLQEMSFLELWEAMLCIEPAVTAAAAVRITETELNLLEENVERTRHAMAHAKGLVALDVEFHTILAAASRSRTLQLCREPIGQVFYPAFLRLVLRLNVGERCCSRISRCSMVCARAMTPRRGCGWKSTSSISGAAMNWPVSIFRNRLAGSVTPRSAGQADECGWKGCRDGCGTHRQHSHQTGCLHKDRIRS